MVTIYDIAKLVGCSPATVSKAFNNYKGVNTDTYNRVMDAADELGYTPNTNARALATKKTWLLGVLFSEELSTGIVHPHFSEILQNFQSRAGDYGYDVVFVNKRLGNKEASYYEHCMYRGVDGVLLAAGAIYTDEIECVLQSDLKSVSVEMIYPNKYTILSDNRMGTLQALEYLYFLGHRKIAHIACPTYSVAGIERFKAYKEFMESKSLDTSLKYYVKAKDFSHEAGGTAASELLQKCWDDLPTAVFVAYDDIACSAMATFKNQGFRIPEDLSIIGFDNILVSRYISPSLTTIEQDRATIGKKSAEVLITMIENDTVEEELEIRIPTKLIVRDSCARLIDK